MEPSDLVGLPGGDLVSAGLRDIEHGIESAASLLVAIGGPRLERLGVLGRGQATDGRVPRSATDSPEIRLYRFLCREDESTAHARLNALVRCLVSFERALEHEEGERLRSGRSSILG